MTNTSTPRGRATGQSFNNRGLLQSTREHSGDTTTFSCDGKGRISSISDLVETKAYTYDANDNILSIVENSKTNFRTYDAYDRPLSYTGTRVNPYLGSFFLLDGENAVKALVMPGQLQMQYPGAILPLAFAEASASQAW